MERCCQRRDSSRALTLKEEVNVFTHVIVDRKNKLLYCYIPKVASSNMKRLMLTLQNFTNDSNLIKHFNKQGFEFLSDVDPTERVAMLKSYFKFLFVRNPQLRLVSAFKNKFLKPNTAFQLMYGQNIVFRYRRPSMPRKLIKGDDVTFQEFTRYLVDKNHDMLTTNEHWMPMYNLCQPCYIKYDFIGSFEELALDTSALLKQIGAPKHASFPRKQKSYGKAITNTEYANFYKNLTLSEFQSLRKTYTDDFTCFNYKFISNQELKPK